MRIRNWELNINGFFSSSAPSGTGGSTHLLECLVDGKASRLLTRRELLECLQKGSHDRLCCQRHIAMSEEPFVVGVRGDISPLERIRTQVIELGYAQRDERLRPDKQRPLNALLHKHDFPVIEA